MTIKRFINRLVHPQEAMRHFQGRVPKGLLLTLALCLLLLAGCQAESDSQEGTSYKQISQEEAAQLMKDGSGYILLDVRTPEEYGEGHIPGAINIPVETIGDQKPEQLPDQDQMILVYCRSGNRSKKAAASLAALGYTNVLEFGGINTWTGEIVK